jgi:exopolyphosphatase/guanosine-5'-triphosphate,3'-diphosphate pyrophosphatase
VTLVGVAGTVTSLAAMAQGLASYDPTRVHGYRLQAAALDAEIARLARSTQAQRETIAGLDPRRADVILAGALILREIARKAGVSEVLVSDRGIRWGLLYEQLAA